MTVTSTLRLESARLIDGTGGDVVPDAVLITDSAGRVDYAGPATGAPHSPGAIVLDLGGRSLLPGFFDVHVHLGLAYGAPITAASLTDPVVSVFQAAQRMRSTLHAGVTSVRDLGGLGAGYRDAVAAGLIEGPRVQVAVRMLSHTGGHGDFSDRDGHALVCGMSELTDTPEQARLAVRRVIRSGADLIKICTTGGMSSPHDDPDDEGLRVAEVQAVVDEARRHGGKAVAAHAQGTAGIHAALRGGVTSVEHGYGIDDEGCDLALESGTFLVPTLATFYSGMDKSRMAPAHYEKKSRWSGITKENIAHAIDRKLKIAVGTDAAISPHGLNLRELSYLVDLGMSPAEAIVAGTRNSAELLGVLDDLGTLEAGKIADFVVCDGNPLDDITVLGDPDRILVVAKDGVLHKDLLSGTGR